MVKKFDVIDTSKLLNNTGYYTKIRYIKEYIPNVTKLAIIASVSLNQNKILIVSKFMKK